MKFSFYLKRRQINLKEKVLDGKWPSWEDLKSWCVKNKIELDVTEESFKSFLPKEKPKIVETPKVIVETPKVEEKPKEEEPPPVSEKVDYSKLSARKLRVEMKEKGLNSLRLSKKEMVKELNNLHEPQQNSDEKEE